MLKEEKKVGNVKNKSIITVIDLSILPLKYPALIPINKPTKEEIVAAKKPIIKRYLTTFENSC